MSDVIFQDGHPFVPYRPPLVPQPEGLDQGLALYRKLENRRSVRTFRSDMVPREMIELAIRAAGTAPSGAHRQPWRFVAISSAEQKKRIRLAAEEEERRNYDGRMPDAWRAALAPLGTDADKSYLEVVPWLVVVFAVNHEWTEEGERTPNYYVRESVGIACGLFISALHQMGLSTLTHTPSPMQFLSSLLGRPSNERPYILFPIGYASEDCLVPDISRKPLDELVTWWE